MVECLIVEGYGNPLVHLWADVSGLGCFYSSTRVQKKNPKFYQKVIKNWEKTCRFQNSYPLKWYETRGTKKYFRGSNFVPKILYRKKQGIGN